MGLERAQFRLVEGQGYEGTTLKKGVSSLSCRRSCKDTVWGKPELGGLVSVLDRLSRYLKEISGENVLHAHFPFLLISLKGHREPQKVIMALTCEKPDY